MANGNTAPDPERKLAPVITWRTTLVTSIDCSTCKLVGLVLSLYMNERGGSAFPSIPTLSEDTSLSERAVRKHLNEHLHAQGWLTLIERGGLKDGHARSNHWQASTPAPDSGVGDEPRHEGTRPRHLTTETPERGAPQVVQEQVHEVGLGGTGVVCSACGETFTTADALCDHVESDCPVLNGDDFTPAADLKVVS